MARIVQSPVKRFAGSVTLPDFLNILQVRAFQEGYFGDPNEVVEAGKKVWLSVSDERVLPVILEIVQEWKLDGVPEKPTLEAFPATPFTDGHELVQWLAGEIYKIYVGETEIPNA